MLRSVAVAAIASILIVPAALAHLIVDVGVVVAAPSYAPAGGTITYKIAVIDFAYDFAYGVIMKDTLATGTRFRSAGGSGWNCNASTNGVTCSAEFLAPGTSTITIVVTAPTATGKIRNTATVETIGSFDYNPRNDSSWGDTIIYQPCNASAPSINGPAEATELSAGSVTMQWQAVAGATGYRVWTAVEGAKATLIAETTDTSLSRQAEFGWNEWWVEAVYDNCPPVASEHRHFFSRGAPAAFAISDFAGQNGISGDADGPRLSAQFRKPVSVGTDLDGNVYVLDEEASTLRKITPDGIVSTVAGSPGMTGATEGPGTLALMNHPAAMAVTSGGYVYIADRGNQTIRQFYPSGNGIIFLPLLFTIAGSPMQSGSIDATGAAARFDSPSGIAAALDYTLFVGDSGNDVIRRITDLTYVVTTVAGTAKRAGAADGREATLRAPSGMAIDASGNVYVADSGNNTIRRIISDGTVTTLAGLAEQTGFADGVGASARFNHPTSLAFDSLGNLYIADTGNHAIRRMAPSTLVTTISTQFSSPTGVAVDSAGNLLIADTGYRVVRIATPTSPLRRRAARH